MDEIFPNLSWMIYFPCEVHFAHQCLCSTLNLFGAKEQLLWYWCSNINLLSKFIHHSEIKYHLKVISGNTSFISRRNVHIWPPCFCTTMPLKSLSISFFSQLLTKSYPWRSWNTNFVTRFNGFSLSGCSCCCCCFCSPFTYQTAACGL